MARTLQILAPGAPPGEAGSIGLLDGERLAGQGGREGQRERHKRILVPIAEARRVIHRIDGLWRKVGLVQDVLDTAVLTVPSWSALTPVDKNGRSACLLGGRI